jgi:menaquinone-specific isochorismate synthase
VGHVEDDDVTEIAPEPVLPDGFSLTSPRSHPDWQRTIADAVDEIAGGRLDKVVVAREVLVEANRPIVVPDVLERLRSLYPACVVFSVDGFLGASPELLVERRGTAVRSHPLAGTFPRSGDPHADELLAAELVASVKDQREHRFVIEEIDRVLRSRCVALDVPSTPSIMQLRNVLHLGTEISGTLSSPAPSALALAAALHPTPAVAGTPTADALAWLSRHEGLSRGRYAGPVGWVDATGDGMFAIGIRSAEVDGRRARLFAGVGVVEGSDPRRELVETQLKLQAILAAVVRP